MYKVEMASRELLLFWMSRLRITVIVIGCAGSAICSFWLEPAYDGKWPRLPCKTSFSLG